MTAQTVPITRARVSLRVSIFNWDNPTRLRELLDYLQTHPGTVDEVALFTQISGNLERGLEDFLPIHPGEMYTGVLARQFHSPSSR